MMPLRSVPGLLGPSLLSSRAHPPAGPLSQKEQCSYVLRRLTLVTNHHGHTSRRSGC
jgi:hypothetical protein